MVMIWGQKVKSKSPMKSINILNKIYKLAEIKEFKFSVKRLKLCPVYNISYKTTVKNILWRFPVMDQLKSYQRRFINAKISQ